jgi:hypothetical protein
LGNSTIFAINFANAGDTVGFSPYSKDLKVTNTGGAPAAPTVLTPVYVNTHDPSDTPSTNEVDLAWKNNSNNETGFKIYRQGPPTYDPTNNYELMASPWKLITTINSADVTTYVDRGMVPGDYQYEVIAFNGAGMSNSDPTVVPAPPNSPAPATPASVGVWPSGYLVAFDGTWNIPYNANSAPWGYWTAIQGFNDGYKGTDKHYEPGVGATGPGIPNIEEGALALGIAQDVANVYMDDVVPFYQSEEHRKDDPLDIIGYSRGCYEGAILAKIISSMGILNTAVHYSSPFQPGRYSKPAPVYPKSFNDKPTVRFLGLVSPVAQAGLDALITALTFGQISLRLGLPTTVPTNVQNTVQIGDGDPNDPIFTQALLGPSGAPGTSYTVDTYSNPNVTHQLVGQMNETLATLVAEAQEDNVPVAYDPQ